MKITQYDRRRFLSITGMSLTAATCTITSMIGDSMITSGHWERMIWAASGR